MKEWSYDFKHAKAQRNVCSGHKLAANIIASDHNTADNLKIHTKKCLNGFNSVDKIMKMATNDDDEIPRWTQQCNHLNLDGIADDTKRVGLVQLMWEGNNHGEKFMQVANMSS